MYNVPEDIGGLFFSALNLRRLGSNEKPFRNHGRQRPLG